MDGVGCGGCDDGVGSVNDDVHLIVDLKSCRR